MDFELWVNLPRKDKMAKPNYQEVSSSKIPFVNNGNVTAKVIAGKAMGARAVIRHEFQLCMFILLLQPSASALQPVQKEYNTFAYVIGGQGYLAPTITIKKS